MKLSSMSLDLCLQLGDLLLVLNDRLLHVNEHFQVLTVVVEGLVITWKDMTEHATVAFIRYALKKTVVDCRHVAEVAENQCNHDCPDEVGPRALDLAPLWIVVPECLIEPSHGGSEVCDSFKK